MKQLPNSGMYVPYLCIYVFLVHGRFASVFGGFASESFFTYPNLSIFEEYRLLSEDTVQGPPKILAVSSETFLLRRTCRWFRPTHTVRAWQSTMAAPASLSSTGNSPSWRNYRQSAEKSFSKFSTSNSARTDLYGAGETWGRTFCASAKCGSSRPISLCMTTRRRAAAAATS